jgi:Putative beta-barrel porin-2, OmpL-like. bbp2
MLQKIFVAAIFALSINNTIAQTASIDLPKADTGTTTPPPDDPKKEPFLVISGSADAYYKVDFANTKANGFTSFTQTHNTFALGMASVKFEHKGRKVSAVADLGFGQRAKDFAYTDDGITQAIKQLYVSYAPTDWVKFTLGTWATHVGYELLDPQLNRNYSMSYMFTNGPFSHTGAKAELTKGKHGLMIGVSNATDFRIIPDGQINRKFFIAQYSFKPTDAISIYLNYAGGQSPDTSKSNQFDAVVTAKIGKKFNIGYNGTINSTKTWDGVKSNKAESWWGSALYFNYDPKSWIGLTLRTELFGDEKQYKVFSGATEGGNVFAATLSASLKTGGFIFIPEFRIDNTKKAVLFTDKNGAFKRSASSFLLAAIYSF